VLCDTCTTGYAVVNNNCNPICGDGLLVPGEPCDDNNPTNGDGCSSTCLV